jgi:hypothetical protein
MIVYEAASSPAARVGEALLAGRRIAARIAPYGFEATAVRFDPVERRFLLPRDEPASRPGPWRTGEWREALSRIPSGPVLIGPFGAAEAVWGSGRAAAEAALDAGRPAYLLDPPVEVVPSSAGRALVLLCSWRPGRPSAAFPDLDRLSATGCSCAALVPLIPGWTAEEDTFAALAERAAAAGAASLTGLVPAGDGEGRRAMVEARSRYVPEDADRFFEVIHHGDWPDRVARSLAAARRAASDRGLAVLPPRPGSRGVPEGNRSAAARLEERAELDDPGEHRAALLHAAVRWIDESHRDLAAVRREGNFRKVFPFDGETREWAENALSEAAG